MAGKREDFQPFSGERLTNPKVIRCEHCGWEGAVNMNFERGQKKIWCLGHEGWMFKDDYTIIDECEYGKVREFVKTVSPMGDQENL